MGRPTKLNHETQAQIVKALNAGATRVDAANSAGIDYLTFLRWLQRGEKSTKGDYRDFCNAVTRAEADVRISLANSLAVQGKTDWRAAEAYLKRRDPVNWGDRINISRMSDEELLRLLALAERLGIESGGPQTGPDASDETLGIGPE